MTLTEILEYYDTSSAGLARILTAEGYPMTRQGVHIWHKRGVPQEWQDYFQDVIGEGDE